MSELDDKIKALETKIKDLESRRSQRPKRREEEPPPSGRRETEIRIAQLTGRVNQLQDELEIRDNLIGEMKTTWQAEVKSLREGTASEVAKVAQTFTEREGYRSIGILDDKGAVDEVAVAALRTLHASLPETTRAKVSPVQMWQDHVAEVKAAREAGKAEPPTHRSLAHLLPPAEEQEQQGKKTERTEPAARNLDASTRRPKDGTIEKRKEQAVNGAKTFAEAMAALKEIDRQA